MDEEQTDLGLLVAKTDCSQTFVSLTITPPALSCSLSHIKMICVFCYSCDLFFNVQGLSMDEEQAARSGLGSLVAKALHLTRKLRDIGIDKEEYALLKCIILCNVGKLCFQFPFFSSSK